MNRTAPMLSEHDVRETPPELFDRLNKRFQFTLDACATHSNAKCDRYFTKDYGLCKKLGSVGSYEVFSVQVPPETGDGLTGSWENERVFFNPPFTEISEWIRKAWKSGAQLVVGLIPGTRCEQDWWHKLVEPYRDGRRLDSRMLLTTEFLQGRQHFLEDGHPIWQKDESGIVKLNKQGQPTRSSPKFGCVLLIWKENK